MLIQHVLTANFFLICSFLIALFTNPVVKSLPKCQSKMTRVAVTNILAVYLRLRIAAASIQSTFLVGAGTGSTPIHSQFYWHTPGS